MKRKCYAINEKANFLAFCTGAYRSDFRESNNGTIL
jgi:hypothetical protein